MLWIDISYYKIPSKEFASQLREQTGLFICEGVNYGDNGDSSIRMNIATSLDNVKDGLNRLKAFLKDEE